jgi:ubiquinol-cytochrome c reductase cytochrome b subunit
MIVLVALHMMRVFTWGSYKAPRELTWLAGVTLVITVMAFSFTGAPLHWDQRGYWAGEVGTSIAGTVPVVGDLVKRIMRGGEEMGQLTLSRFFVAHAAILPGALLALFGIHFIAMRRFGSTGPWDPAKRQTSGPFWPDQAFKDVVVGSGVFFVLICLAVFYPPTYSGPADALDTTYIPKPEWNFLFLYQALKYFQGPLEPVGTIGVPTVFIVLLLALPFIDRNPEKNPGKRPVVMICGLVYAGALLVLTLIGYYSPGLAEMPVVKETSQRAAAKPAPQTPAVPAAAGKMPQLFQTAGCTGCHRIGGAGGVIGPELSPQTLKGKDRQWLIGQIRNPKSHNPKSVMPAFTSLSDKEVNELVGYLLRLTSGSGGASSDPPVNAASANKIQPEKQPAHKEKPTEAGPLEGEIGRAAYVIGSAEHGAELFEKNCSPCHGPKGADNVPNPGSEDAEVPSLNPIDRDLYDADAQTFAENIDKYIQHGSVPRGTNPVLRMPSFGDSNSLTQQEIASLEAYILSLNGVDRAQLLNAGMRPLYFFWLALAMYILLILIQGGIRVKKKIP